MLVWAKKNHINDNYKKVFQEIQSISNYYGNFKIWEAPFMYFWLQRLSKKLNKKLKVLDFGCGISPFPTYLTSKGFKVFGIDNNNWTYKDNVLKNFAERHPKVSYWWGNIFDYNKEKFDVIISISVFEHIIPFNIKKQGTVDKFRIEIMKKLQSLLVPEGSMLHIIDYYYPENHHVSHDYRVNFFNIAEVMNFSFKSSQLCPGSSDFNFKLLSKLNILNIKPGRPQSRIAIGNDILKG